MQDKYYKTEHSIKAYSDIDYPHPRQFWDLEYEEKCRQYPKVVDRVITTVKRVQVGPQEEGEKPKEYVVWNELEIRMNDLGNKETVVRTQLGIYPILEAHYIWKWRKEGNKEKVHDRQPEEYLGYYQEWNEKTKKEIAPYILKSQNYKRKLNATQFAVQKEGGYLITVENYNDFMTKPFDELYKEPILQAPSNSVTRS